MSKNRKPSNFIGFDTGRIMCVSPPWMKLSGTAIKMYFIFKCKCQVTKIKTGKKKGFKITNNGEIQFTITEAIKKLGKTKSTVIKAKDELVKYGFIDVAHAGGCLDGDCGKYGISERWMKYGTPEFKEIIRPKDTRNRGFRKNPENRFKQNPGSESSTGAVQKTQPVSDIKRLGGTENSTGSIEQYCGNY